MSFSNRKKNNKVQSKINQERKKNSKIPNDQNSSVLKKTAGLEKKQSCDEAAEIIKSLSHDHNDQDSTQKKQKVPPKTREKKHKTFIQKDMTDKPVYLEDTGEKLGTVIDTLYDNHNHLTGYRIKDSNSESVLDFSVDQFDMDKNGLIFIPGWYTKAVKILEKFEFKDRISPELTTLLMDTTITHDELYNIFVRHDDEMAEFMKEASSLRETLYRRLELLERQRIELKENLMDLTERRLIKDIDRREFSENVMEHRRKVNILDVNIKKCHDLLQRLNNTSFGMIITKDMLNMDAPIKNDPQDFKDPTKPLDDLQNNPNREPERYKEMYHDLKERFDNLQERYSDLKESVEKMMQKKYM